MISLALNGITSFTEIPLKIITVLGMLVSLFSFGIAAWALITRFFNPSAVPGWASIVIPLCMLGGISCYALESSGNISQKYTPK
jgi:hypothetical protein